MNASALAQLRDENTRLQAENDSLHIALIEAEYQLDRAVKNGFELVIEVANWSQRALAAEGMLRADHCEFPSCEEPATGARMCSVHANVRVVGSWVSDRHGSAS